MNSEQKRIIDSKIVSESEMKVNEMKWTNSIKSIYYQPITLLHMLTEAKSKRIKREGIAV